MTNLRIFLLLATLMLVSASCADNGGECTDSNCDAGDDSGAGDSDSDSDMDADADADSDSDTDADSDTDSDTDANTDGTSDTSASSDPTAIATDSQTDTDFNQDRDTISDTSIPNSGLDTLGNTASDSETCLAKTCPRPAADSADTDSADTDSATETPDTAIDVSQPLYVDVRTAGEYETAHYPGAINIPLDELPNRLTELYPKERAIIVYCHSGSRASQAKSILDDNGFTNVTNGGRLDDLLNQ